MLVDFFVGRSPGPVLCPRFVVKARCVRQSLGKTPRLHRLAGQRSACTAYSSCKSPRRLPQPLRAVLVFIPLPCLRGHSRLGQRFIRRQREQAIARECRGMAYCCQVELGRSAKMRRFSRVPRSRKKRPRILCAIGQFRDCDVFAIFREHEAPVEYEIAAFTGALHLRRAGEPISPGRSKC